MVKKIRSEFQSRSEEEDSPVSRCSIFVKGTMSLDFLMPPFTPPPKLLLHNKFSYWS